MKRQPDTEFAAFISIAPNITREPLNRKAFVQVLEDSGDKIATAEQSISSEGASPAVSPALRVTAAQSCAQGVTRVIHGSDGTPVQLLLNWYRADRFEFRMRISRAQDATKVWVEYH